MASSRTRKILELASLVNIGTSNSDVIAGQNKEPDFNPCIPTTITTAADDINTAEIIILQDDFNEGEFGNTIQTGAACCSIDHNKNDYIIDTIIPSNDPTNNINVLYTLTEIAQETDNLQEPPLELNEITLPVESIPSTKGIIILQDITLLNNSNNFYGPPQMMEGLASVSADNINEAESERGKVNPDWEESSEDTVHETESDFTKKGNKRKRRKYKHSLVERKAKLKEKSKRAHYVRDGCGASCKKQCSKTISNERRLDINCQFWDANRLAQKSFVLGCVNKVQVKRKTVGLNSRRSVTNTYVLKDTHGISVPVCKIFFLTTLGFHKNNDKILESMYEKSKDTISPKKDKRIGRVPPNKIDHDTIAKHIESFVPNISHYRRVHAPNRRYLPSDLTVTMLYEDFQRKFPSFKCSYDLYRTMVRKLNISFVKLGHEECEECEHFNLHNHNKENLDPECNTCTNWQSHIKRAEAARINYRIDADKDPTDEEVIFSVDLQKVIMLPRCDMFKNVIFTQRLVAFNESFVPVGTKNKTIQPMAAIWHEAIRGRKKEDIISAYHKFFLSQRDTKKIILWVDNCTSQNKNWAFFCFLTYVVNSPSISTEIIEVNYFEPGHTYMSADSFHHQVEKALKKCKKVYDFSDYKASVKSANSGKVSILEMELQDFFEFKDHSSKYKLKQEGRPYIKDMVKVVAERGKMFLLYKNSFDDCLLPLNFLNAKVMKSGIPSPKPQQNPRGITVERRDGIINLIKGNKSIIPQSRLQFWTNIPASTEAETGEEMEVTF